MRTPCTRPLLKTNGNQVLIVYKAGAGIPSAATNTSARISTIADVRAPSWVGASKNLSRNNISTCRPASPRRVGASTPPPGLESPSG